MKNKRTIKINFLAITAMLLGITFIIFKVLGIGLVAAWSWLWVLAPIWIYMIYNLVVAIIATMVALMISRKL